MVCYSGIIFPEVRVVFEKPSKDPLEKEFIRTTDAETSTARFRHLQRAKYVYEMREIRHLAFSPGIRSLQRADSAVPGFGQCQNEGSAAESL